MNKYGRNILLLLSLLVLLGSCNLGNHLKKGEQSYALGEYNEASKHYKKAYSRVSSKDRKKRGEVAYKLAECYRLTNYTLRARGAYLNTIRYRYPDSIAFLHLAETQLKSADYKGAEESFKTYLTYKPGDPKATTGLESCLLAQEWKKSPTQHIVKKATLFGSRRAEYSPMYAGSETDQLYFTSSRDEAKGNNLNGITGMKSTDIFVSNKNEKKLWQVPEVIESEINSEFEDGACSFSADGKTMYFTRCRREPNSPVYAEIYSSARTGANWGTPLKCTIINDSLSSVAHPAINPEGTYLYFTSDMPGGYGGMDLWRIPVANSGFGAVENLGEEINTVGDEVFPTFRPNGELYFSSNGHPGMGGLDLFCANQDKVGKWNISNMRSPINSPSDDFGMTYETEFNRGFFASNRGDARGWDHIYSFEVPETTYTLTGWVYEKEAYELPEAVVTLVGKDGTYQKVNVKKDGSFSHKVEQGMSYVMLASCRGYLNLKQELITDTVSENKEYVVQFPLSSITRPVLIENIFYEFDKATLTDESTRSLDELVKLLNDNPNVTIELGAHCDYKGNDDYNLRLSQRRAESVMNYLIAGGIEKERLTAIGYGENTPKTIRKRVTEKMLFTKEGDILTEAYILALTPEQQEVCNAMNRRTEFKVLRTTYKLY